ncbi:Ig-like domain-containing protein [Halosquirtibacter laminarini]|uniref:Ig-like domain-containing protein n=1 Tax=Halosquirtibacter laminarini TaxID=3374600 RepID=A0AC61NMV7_9BACT|nr:Ig-like domain-containing protein [Prolixibacteraceae bacterium]
MNTKFSYIAFLSIILTWIASSCANVGRPTGGDKDTIPPTVVEMVPNIKETNFKGDEFKVVFNEFVSLTELRQKLVVSPPQKEKPEIKTRGKLFVVTFKDTMLQNTTYTLDFKDAVEDYNEGNKLLNFRTSFSTGKTIDTLRIAGMVRDAKNLMPVDDATIFIYSDLADSAAIKERPNYIAKTNKEGVFIVDGLAAKTYKIYAVSDLNGDGKLDNHSEPYAFLPHTLTPSAKFIPEQDTMVRGLDTLLVTGTINYSPKPVLLSMSQEKVLLQTMNDYKRIDSTHFYIGFSESLDDNFKIEAINIDKPIPEWLYKETSLENDSINFWITDPEVYSKDTILISVTYTVPDSLYNPKIQTDTLELLKPKKIVPKKKRRRKIKDNKVTIPTFTWESNGSQTVDPYSRIYLETKEPVASLPKESLHLTEKIDTLDVPVPFTITKDEYSERLFYIDFKMKESGNYKLLVDSAATKNIYQALSNKLDMNIKVQKESYYGKIILDIKNIVCPTLIQLLKNDKDETVVNELTVHANGKIDFFYVKPGKYILKAIFDRNNNGVWDPGNLLNQQMPEGVVYYQEVMNIRSNWDNEKYWDLPNPLEFTKDIQDNDKKKKDVMKDLN